MQNIHPRLGAILEASGTLAEAAALTARPIHKQIQKNTLPKRGRTLRPGGQTPLWNELAGSVRATLTTYGDKAKLGRFLGVPRQRIDEYLRGRSIMPDAERTLLLLHWLDAKKRGIEIS